MSTPVIVWTVTIGLFAALAFIRFTVEIARVFHGGHYHGFFTTGTEREEFFVPGDPNDDEEEALNDED